MVPVSEKEVILMKKIYASIENALKSYFVCFASDFKAGR